MSERKPLLVSLGRNRSIIGHIEEASDPIGICILVHGIGDRYSSFRGLLDEITCHRFSAFLFDLPGHGENRDVSIPFEENIDLLDRIIDQHTSQYSRHVVIGHSFGGLIALLNLCRHRPPQRVLAVEASITEPDYEFFEWVQEPPIGVGYDGLLSSFTTDSFPYASTYAANLADTSAETFRCWTSTVFTNFFRYRNEIIESGLRFTYVYGLDSPGAASRQSLEQHSNVRVLAFPRAAHWVHIDSQASFVQQALNGLLDDSEAVRNP